MTKILIVEDEEAISNLIRMSLCKTGSYVNRHLMAKLLQT